MEQKAAEITNIHVRNVASLATTSSRDAFNLLIASGNLPDIVGGDATGGLKEDFIRYGLEGAFIPLDDLIEENAPTSRHSSTATRISATPSPDRTASSISSLTSLMASSRAVGSSARIGSTSLG